MRKLSLFVGILAIAAFTGCQDSVTAVDNQAAVSPEAAQVVSALSKAGHGGRIWADGELYGTIGTPATFDGEHGKYDILYQGNFKDGVHAISESKPGDQDWNGGRWDVYQLNSDVGSKYDNADEDSDLDLSDFHAAGIYVECPLLHLNGHGNN